MPAADSRASKSSLAYDARMMRIAGGSLAFIARTRFLGGIGLVRLKCATNPFACTPASVRDEPNTRTGAPSRNESASSTISCMPTAFSWYCQPEYEVPS